MKVAIIPASGLGTRLYPLTRLLPKEMLPILGKPIIDFILEEAINVNPTRVVVVTTRHKRKLIRHCKKNRPNVELVYQDSPNGLRGAIREAVKYCEGGPLEVSQNLDYFVLLPDTLIFGHYQLKLGTLVSKAEPQNMCQGDIYYQDNRFYIDVGRYAFSSSVVGSYEEQKSNHTAKIDVPWIDIGTSIGAYLKANYMMGKYLYGRKHT